MEHDNIDRPPIVLSVSIEDRGLVELELSDIGFHVGIDDDHRSYIGRVGKTAGETIVLLEPVPNSLLQVGDEGKGLVIIKEDELILQVVEVSNDMDFDVGG